MSEMPSLTKPREFYPEVIPFHFLSDSSSTPLNLPLLRGGAVGGGVHPYQPFREIV
ncbi:hypothetical protein QUB80_32520 [Chlorogloeopsis sp. ULAP01]|uniref:hypothetical protein n=1 Tax=Chlorogloeopsis sp. ULAP01 TaxID=3056483 RepID=UPI0025AACA7B|nr:hypothetical protein [Chlorogloeopsis sp. ULAP01]MDM9385381.1 hypothetical protein [Chlorogloeopsis sp. ULAP01]